MTRKRRCGTHTSRVEAFLLANPGALAADIGKACSLALDQVRKSVENLRHLKLVMSEAKRGSLPCRYWHITHAELAQAAQIVPPELPPHRIEQAARRKAQTKRAQVERPRPIAVTPNRSPVAQPRTARSTEERIEYREIDGRLVRVTIGRTHDTTPLLTERAVTMGCGPGRYLHADTVISRAYQQRAGQ